MPDVHLLPYRTDVLAYLREQKDLGRPVILATAADEKLAREVDREVGVFDEILASDGNVHLSGKRKRDRLIAEFGQKGFDYIGNRAGDYPVWGAARRALLVSPSAASRAPGGRGRAGGADPAGTRRPVAGLSARTAASSLDQEWSRVPAARLGAPVLRLRSAGTGHACVHRLQPLRVKRLSAQRFAGSARRPVPSAQEEAASRIRQDPARPRAADDAAAARRGAFAIAWHLSPGVAGCTGAVLCGDDRLFHEAQGSRHRGCVGARGRLCNARGGGFARGGHRGFRVAV